MVCGCAHLCYIVHLHYSLESELTACTVCELTASTLCAAHTIIPQEQPYHTYVVLVFHIS